MEYNLYEPHPEHLKPRRPLISMILQYAGSERGLTLIQWIVCAAIVLVVGGLVFPKWLEERRVSQAVVDTQVLADACRKFVRDTATYPESFGQLMQSSGTEGSLGPYIESIPKTPWGGDYVLLADRYKVAISPSVEGVPKKYRLGEIAEISAVYKEGASWW